MLWCIASICEYEVQRRTETSSPQCVSLKLELEINNGVIAEK